MNRQVKKSTRFYVYEHWRHDRGECFYVGKGHGRRAYEMHRSRNRWHKFLQAKLAALGTAIEIKIVADGLTEEEAFSIEMERIAFWKNDGADLCNLTLGGEGQLGCRHTDKWKKNLGERMRVKFRDPREREKISIAMKGIKRTEEQKANYRKPKSAEHIDAIRGAAIGRKRPVPRTDTHRKNQSDALKRAMTESWRRRKARKALHIEE